MRRLQPLLLSLALCSLPGCYRVMALLNDTGADEPDGPETPEASKRSYDNPDVAMSAGERADIEAMCSGVVEEDRKGTPRGKDKGAYGQIKAKSKWGGEMINHLNQEGRHVAAPRIARLLQYEGLKWASADCRTLINRYSSYN
jgi:hypothetical protein